MDEAIAVNQTLTYRLRTPHPVPPAAYAGPGNIVSGATGWWGLRAYTLASVGSNAVRLRRDSDNAEQDFTTVTGGGLDETAITSFKGAANLFIVSLYDQSGNANPMTQSTAANQPPFIQSGLGSLPVIRATADPQTLMSSAITLNQPLTHSFVAKRTGNIGNSGAIFGDLDAAPRTGYWGADEAFLYDGGTAIGATALDNVFHAVQAVCNVTVADLNVDGTSMAGSSGGLGYSNQVQFNQDGGLRADVTEMGLWPVAFSSTQSSNMSANQHAYWGF